MRGLYDRPKPLEVTVPRTREPVEHSERECEAPSCSNRFVPARSTARFCTRTCAQRAARARKAAEQQTEVTRPGSKTAEHTLVKAVAKALDEAGVSDTWQGELALETARRAVSPEAKGDALLDKLDARMATALAAAPAPAGEGTAPPAGPAPAPEDAIAAARRRRDEVTAAAAAEAAAASEGADEAEG